MPLKQHVALLNVSSAAVHLFRLALRHPVELRIIAFIACSSSRARGDELSIHRGHPIQDLQNHETTLEVIQHHTTKVDFGFLSFHLISTEMIMIT
jgi:hypothetical protein